MTATVSPITSGAPEAPETGVSLSDYVPYRLATASAAVSRLIARAYEDRFGLTIPQWRLMSVLAEGSMDAVQNDPKVIEVYLGESQAGGAGGAH